MLKPITDVDAYGETREGWHALAERVLAPVLHGATGHIGLRVDDAGITTPPFGPDDRRVRAWVGNLEVRSIDGERTTSLTTLGAAAAFVGVDARVDTGVYTATTTTDPTAWIAGDDRSASALVEWFGFGDRILRAWTAAHADESPSEVQLWPEHFDLGTDLGPDDGRRANYGASPGDVGHPLPYLYVGPWAESDDPFWDAGSYARLPYETLAAAADPEAAAAEFFRRGYETASSPKS
jgi:hypothetical protein